MPLKLQICEYSELAAILGLWLRYFCITRPAGLYLEQATLQEAITALAFIRNPYWYTALAFVLDPYLTCILLSHPYLDIPMSLAMSPYPKSYPLSVQFPLYWFAIALI